MYRSCLTFLSFLVFIGYTGVRGEQASTPPRFELLLKTSALVTLKQPAFKTNLGQLWRVAANFDPRTQMEVSELAQSLIKNRGAVRYPDDTLIIIGGGEGHPADASSASDEQIGRLGALALVPLVAFQAVAATPVANLGAGPDQDKVSAAINAALSKLYYPAFNGALLPVVSLATPGLCRILIRDFNPTSDVKVNIPMIAYGPKGIPRADLQKTLGHSLGAAIEADVQRFQDQVQAYANRQPGAGQIWLHEQVDNLRFHLVKGAKEVPEAEHTGAVMAEVKGQNLELTVGYNVTLTELSLGAGYGSPSGPVATLSLTTQDWKYPNDSLGVILQGGPDSWKGSAFYEVTTPLNRESTWKLTYRPHADYAQVNALRLGNVDGPDIHEQTISGGLKVEAVYDSSAKAQIQDSAPSVNKLRLAGDAFLRSVNASGPATLIGTSASDFGPCLLLSAGVEHRTTFHSAGSGLGENDVQASLSNLLVGGMGESNPTYLIQNLRAENVLFYGWATPRDLLSRFIVSAGLTEGPTPRFDYPSLGGDTNNRGIRQGEIIGRETLSETFEQGVAVGSLIDCFSPPAKPGDSTSTASGFDFHSLYLKGMLDHGNAWGCPSLPGYQVLDPSIFSYGVGAEFNGTVDKQTLRLGLGYMWANQSPVNGGRFFVNALTEF